MANGNLYRGYPSLTQGIEAGKELVTLFTSGGFAGDIKHSMAVCDTVGGAILGVYPGAPGTATTQALSVEVKQEASEVFAEVQKSVEGYVREVNSPVSKATREGSKGLGAQAFDPVEWLPYLQILLELLRKWFNRAV